MHFKCSSIPIEPKCVSRVYELGRGLQGRGRGSIRVHLAFLLVSQGARVAVRSPLISIGYRFPFRCHGSGQHSTWT